MEWFVHKLIINSNDSLFLTDQPHRKRRPRFHKLPWQIYKGATYDAIKKTRDQFSGEESVEKLIGWHMSEEINQGH